MILEAWYLNRRVYLTVPDTDLVFDGFNFVRPAEAQQVQLGLGIPVVITMWDTPEQPVICNRHICKVIGVHDATPNPGGSADSEVVWTPDPGLPTCLCAVTLAADGTRISNVAVTVRN